MHVIRCISVASVSCLKVHAFGLSLYVQDVGLWGCCICGKRVRSGKGGGRGKGKRGEGVITREKER